MLFALYWAFGGLVNLVDYIPAVAEKTVVKLNVIYNLLDMPMVLAIFYFTTSIHLIKKITQIAVPLYLVLAIINSVILGLNYDALKYMLALGLIFVLTILIWEIIVNLQKVQHTSREKALVLIYAALLFQYGTYIIIYIFDYYLISVSNVIDNFIIYYISSVVALAIASGGLLLLNGRKKAAGRQNPPNSQRSPQAESPLSTY